MKTAYRIVLYVNQNRLYKSVIGVWIMTHTGLQWLVLECAAVPKKTVTRKETSRGGQVQVQKVNAPPCFVPTLRWTSQCHRPVLRTGLISRSSWNQLDQLSSYQLEPELDHLWKHHYEASDPITAQAEGCHGVTHYFTVVGRPLKKLETKLLGILTKNIYISLNSNCK